MVLQFKSRTSSFLIFFPCNYFFLELGFGLGLRLELGLGFGLAFA